MKASGIGNKGLPIPQLGALVLDSVEMGEANGSHEKRRQWWQSMLGGGSGRSGAGGGTDEGKGEATSRPASALDPHCPEDS